MIFRVIITVFAFMLYGVFAFSANTSSTLYSGKAAGMQFQSNDMNHLFSVSQIQFWSYVGVWPTIFLLFALFLIWFKPVKNWVKTLAFIMALGISNQAFAYYDTSDKAEAYTILPNESAFWIPDVGDRKNDQTRLDSEAFLEANRISLSRFVIPHAKFQNSGGWIGFDAFVPTGRLIIVDRTPFTREWVDSNERGTSHKKEGFPCQSIEGINATVGVSISTYVLEGPQASRFLYNFGVVKTTGDRMDRQVIFASVFYGRSLTEVMDQVVRHRVQTLVCREIGSRTIDQINLEANKIMENVETETRKYLNVVGISLGFIGYADTITFDADIQKAINDKYVADKLAPVISMLAQINQLKVQEGLGTGLANKGVPIVVTPGMIEALENLVRPTAPAIPAK